MASISTNKKTGERTLGFTINGKRKSIWLGKMSKRDVATWKHHVEELVAAKKQNNRAPYDETSAWVAGLDVELHKKLVGADLVGSRAPVKDSPKATLGAFLVRLVADPTAVLKSSTKTAYGHSQRCLIEFFEGKAGGCQSRWPRSHPLTPTAFGDGFGVINI